MTRCKPILLLIGLLAGASLSASCGERLADDEQQPDERLLACAAISVHVQVEDGWMWLLDEELKHPYWCTCITEEELDDELRTWANERAYATCVEFVEHLGHDPELSNCGELYEEGYWGEAGFPDSPYLDFLYCDDLGELHPRIKVE